MHGFPWATNFTFHFCEYDIDRLGAFSLIHSGQLMAQELANSQAGLFPLAVDWLRYGAALEIPR